MRLLGKNPDGSMVCPPQDRHIELREFAEDLGLHLYPDELRRVIHDAKALLADVRELVENAKEADDTDAVHEEH